jgi:hypothetical protein
MPENAIGLAKSAGSSMPIDAPTHGDNPERSYTHDNIPLDVFNYFDVDPNFIDRRESRQIGEVYSSLRKISKNDEEVMSKIILLDHKVGPPSGKDNRWSRIWSFIKILGVANVDRNN